MVVFSKEKKTAFINRIREMLDEERDVPGKANAQVEEIPESTPHYLNPKILAENGSETPLDMSGEEVLEEADALIDRTERRSEDSISAHGSDSASPEKMEEVLEKGMQFLSGLMAMATGKPLLTEEQEKQIHVDRNTGEVTMKFKLPGFPR